MSVINQMLKDLEQRKQADSSSAPVLTAPRVTSSMPAAWVWLLVILLSAAAGSVIYHFVVNWQQPLKIDQAVETQLMTPLQSVPKLRGDDSVPVTTSDKPDVESDPQIRLAAEATPLVSVEQATTQATKEMSPLPAESSDNAQGKAKSSKSITASPLPSQPETVARETKPAKQSRTANNGSNVKSDLKITQVKLSADELAAVKYRQATQAIAKQRLEKSQQLLNQVLELQPKNVQARVDLANQYYLANQIADVVRVLEKGVQIEPENTQFRRMLAKIFMENNNLQQAYAYTKMMPQGAVLDAEYMTLRAGLAQRLSYFAEAQQSYRILLEYQPRVAKWWLGLAVSSDKLKQNDVAREAYQSALREAGLSDASRRFAEQRLNQLEVR